jgi:hypothetical protein
LIAPPIAYGSAFATGEGVGVEEAFAGEVGVAELFGVSNKLQ